MKVYIPQKQDAGVIIGAHPSYSSTYQNICIEIKGHTKAIGACGVTIEMTPYQAICMAIELIHKANKHADDIHSNTANALKRLTKKYGRVKND
jgi:hypothetical protein